MKPKDMKKAIRYCACGFSKVEIKSLVNDILNLICRLNTYNSSFHNFLQADEQIFGFLGKIIFKFHFISKKIERRSTFAIKAAIYRLFVVSESMSLGFSSKNCIIPYLSQSLTKNFDKYIFSL